MPARIPYHKAPGTPAAARVYERAAPRQEDKNFYSSTRWVKLRRAFLAEHPTCNGPGCTALAHHVDHILERKARPDLAHEWDNLQGLCVPCHNRKRAGR